MSGRVDIDVTHGRAVCKRCGTVVASSELAELLKFSRAHSQCAGEPAAPAPVQLTLDTARRAR